MSLNLFNNRLSRLRERISNDLALLAGKNIPDDQAVTEESDIADLPTSLVPAINLEDYQTMPHIEVVKVSTPAPAGPPRVYEYSPLILDDTGEIAPTSSCRVTSHDGRPIGHRMPAIGVTNFIEDYPERGYTPTHIQLSYRNFGQFLDWQELDHLMKYALPAGIRIVPAEMPDDLVTVIGKLPTERQTHV